VGRQNECRARIAEGGDCGAGDQCRGALDCIRGACARTCDSDGGCRAGEFCFNGGCAPKVANGGACVEGRVCASGICDFPVCADCVNSDQCGSNRYCELNPGQNFCRTRKAEGASCDNTPQCAAGLSCRRGTCHRSCSSDGQCRAGEFCFDGGCDPKLANGALCVEARVCQSGICNTGACRECGNNSHCGSNSFCALFQCEARRPAGSRCGNNFECQSGLFCGADRICREKLASGAVCLSNEVCRSGRCVFRVIPPLFTCD
jgi:hypothetical protein